MNNQLHRNAPHRTALHRDSHPTRRSVCPPATYPRTLARRRRRHSTPPARSHIGHLPGLPSTSSASHARRARTRACVCACVSCGERASVRAGRAGGQSGGRRRGETRSGTEGAWERTDGRLQRIDRRTSSSSSDSRSRHWYAVKISHCALRTLRYCNCRAMTLPVLLCFPPACFAYVACAHSSSPCFLLASSISLSSSSDCGSVLEMDGSCCSALRACLSV